jgi:hypothetical protein
MCRRLRARLPRRADVDVGDVPGPAAVGDLARRHLPRGWSGGTQHPDQHRIVGPTPSEVGGNTQAAPPSPFAKPPGSTDTTGLTLQVRKLALKVGNPNGIDTESPGAFDADAERRRLVPLRQVEPDTAGALRARAGRGEDQRRGSRHRDSDGYTDSIGTDAVNIPLSQRRARSVVDFLKPATAGAPVSYTSHGFGSSDPVAPKTHPDGSDARPDAHAIAESRSATTTRRR